MIRWIKSLFGSAGSKCTHVELAIAVRKACPDGDAFICPDCGKTIDIISTLEGYKNGRKVVC